MNPQYETKLTAITPTSQGKVTVASVVVSENGFTADNQYTVDGDYMVGVKVKRDNKERVCLIALNDDRSDKFESLGYSLPKVVNQQIVFHSLTAVNLPMPWYTLALERTPEHLLV